MKILFSALQYPSDKHPFAAFISMMAQEMAHRGNDVIVVSPQSITHHLIRKKPLLRKYEEIKIDKCNNIIKVYRPISLTFGSNKFLGRLTLLVNRFVAHKCIKKIGGNFDVFYAHFWEAAFNVVKMAKQRDIPLVVVSGEDRILLPKFITLKEMAELKNVTVNVVAVSTKNKNESIVNNLTEESRCHIIPNGPDVNLFHRLNKTKCREILGFDNDCFIVAFVGRFIHRKGAKRVENAILKLHDSKIKAIFLGSVMSDEDPNEDPCGDEIIFKGIVPHKEIPLYLNAADIYVLPTLAEGCSNSIVEAMACGLPIISSNKDFNYDVLNSANSILIDPLNENDIANAIKKLKEDETLRTKMSESAIKSAESLDFNKRVDKILHILKNSIKQ